MIIAHQINILARFLGPRDVPKLSQVAFQKTIGHSKVDVCALFGGSIIAGVDVLAEAMQHHVAKHYVIVGGYGHTTEKLFAQVAQLYPEVTPVESEAELFSQILQLKYGLSVDALETKSTNCGNNITNLLTLVAAHNWPCESVLLMQDATMQLRMHATMNKVAPAVQVVDYATYQVTVTDDLRYGAVPEGMWAMHHYLTLLCGELPRLRDDANGYGPQGKNYLAHVHIPDAVERAWQTLVDQDPSLNRKADPRFKS
ncbi:YdcF family protein [Lacticaseibacillus porcinae]|uniref:YdcF family protein n=1 Tax=Lacticaseibacillus porcinae TaxID=1123687 RepID=UPI000F7931E2|nr:YdcF family protein [Lacticaseibacillus porcinae]